MAADIFLGTVVGMDKTWLIYTGVTIAYIIVLIWFFIRRSKKHEAELSQFLELAQEQLEVHKKQSAAAANQVVAKAMMIVKKIQTAAMAFETQAQTEYDRILEEAKSERRELIAKTKTEIEALFKEADHELETYQLMRHREIEKNLVKLVTAVAERVIGSLIDEKQHKNIIFKSLEEIKKQHTRT